MLLPNLMQVVMNSRQTDARRSSDADTMNDDMQRLGQVIDSVRAHHDCDIMVYSGPINYVMYWQLLDVTAKERERANLLLVLGTLGGDPHAAYRVAKCLGERYGKVTILIPGTCKSAGTLLALGAHDLVIADAGELGPLDIQLRKPDELMAYSSGLDTKQALDYIAEKVLNSFRDFLLDFHVGAQLGTKTAASIATEMTVGLFGKIYEQVDPVKLGEVVRATDIANEYGRRLAGNLRPDGLTKLVNGYPAHGFVIDYEEARGLFNNVRRPDTAEESLLELLSDIGMMDKLRSPPERGADFGIIRPPNKGEPDGKAEAGSVRPDDRDPSEAREGHVSSTGGVHAAVQECNHVAPQNGTC